MREPERCAYCSNIITGSRNKRIKLHFCSRTCSGMYHKLHPANTRPGSGSASGGENAGRFEN